MAFRRLNYCTLCERNLTSLRERMRSRLELARARYYRVFKRDLGNPSVLNWTFCDACTQWFFRQYQARVAEVVAAKAEQGDKYHGL